MLLAHTIYGPPQSGKTTLALGALERLHRQGHKVAYVVPTRDWARDARRRTDVPCLSIADVAACTEENWRAVVIEDAGHLLPPEVLRTLRDRLGAVPGPAQLIIVRST